jgi:hypothetical protein
MRRVKTILASAILAVTVGFAVAGPAAAAVTPGEYVALGDSYASGVGAPPYDPASGDCKQSPDSYPRTWAKNHPDFTLKDMTCSGAKIDDVRTEQLSALSADTTLVTITVGGNDDGFGASVSACLTGTDEDCKASTDLGAYLARHELVDQLAALYTEVKGLAPNARVIVLGYSNLIDPGSGSCGAITPNAFKRNQILFNTYHMGEGLRTATERAGVSYVDMRLALEGHEACSADPFINGVDFNRVSEMFHPNVKGHNAYAFWLTLEIEEH